MKHVLAAIDIGTTKVSVLIGYPDSEGIRIIGAGKVAARGVEKGMLSDLNAVTECIVQALQIAEKSSGYRVEGAFVSLGGASVSSRNSHGETQVAKAMRGIEKEDVERALANASNVVLPEEQQLLHVVTRGFWLDDTVPAQDPIGMSAYRLGAEVHVITASCAAVRNTYRSVNGAGVAVDGLIAQALASGEAVLTKSEREMGVALVDIGGGTADVAVYMNGGIWHTASIPTGGRYITNDLAIGLHCPFEVAEDIKLRFGHCLPGEVNGEERIRVAGFTGFAGREVLRREAAEIIEARAEEILTLVLRELRRSAYDGLLPAGVVLCGGTAGLPGIDAMAAKILSMPVRIGVPGCAAGLNDVINDSAQATGVGLLAWGSRQPVYTDSSEGEGFGRKIMRILRSILPGQTRA